MKKIALTLGLLILIPVLPLWAQTSASDAALGEKLVRQNFTNLGSVKLAEGFQSVHQNGVRDREGEIKALKTIHIRDHTLSDFKVTREANVLVVTYTFAGNETVGGKKASTKPTPRLTIFINTGKEWLWLAHANLSAVKK